MIGEIVEFREHGNIVCALVLEPGERLRVLTERGGEMRLPAGRIVHRTGETVPGSPTPEQAAEALRAFGERADALVDEVDLTRLWERTVDAGKVLPLAGLADRVFDDPGPSERSAVLRALAAGQALFRQARGGFAPRARAEVEQARREEQRRREEEARRESFAAWLEAARRAGRPGAMPDGAGEYIDRLARYAASGPEGRPALELDLLARAGLAPDQATPGNVLRLLVEAGVLSEDENLLLYRFERRIEFPAEVKRAAADAVSEGFSADGRSATPEHPAVFSVDDAETQEIDDAIQLLGRRADGGWQVAVYIADPDALVPAGGVVDEEAAQRGSTLYLPDRRIPMLPPAICDDAACLVAGQPRPALAFRLEISPDGELLDSDIEPVTVTVRERRTFEEVEQGLAGGDAELNELLACADAMRGARHNAGAYLLTQPDVMPRVDDQGRVTLKRYNSASPSARLVAELMVAANRTAARLCETRGVAAPFRCQRAGSQTPPQPALGSEYDPLVHKKILDGLDRTELKLEPGPHAGLGAECYLQVTSPLRRYADWLSHRQLKAALAGLAPPYQTETLRDRLRDSERLAGECRQIEAWARGYFLLKYLGERIGERCTGVVLRRIDERFSVELLEYAHRTMYRPGRKVEIGERLSLEVRGANPRQGRLRLAEVRE